jgi:hypothetical protein
MKYSLLILLFISTTISALAQKTVRQPDTTKYRINLPDYWKPGNKVWSILIDKLPEVCDELKNKDLCGDHCNAMYTVDFQMSEPLILERYAQRISGSAYEFITLYTFESSLLLKNRKDSLLTRIVLADTNEVFSVKQKGIYDEHIAPPPPQRFSLVKVSTAQAVLVNSVNGIAPVTTGKGGSAESLEEYIYRNREKFSPAQKDMLEVIDRKLKALSD